MRFPRRPLIAAVLAIAASTSLVACGGGGDGASTASKAAVSGAYRHIVYVSEADIGQLLERLLPNGGGPMNKLGAYRQLPGERSILPPESRIARVVDDQLAPLSAQGMARTLRRAINGTCSRKLPCRSHLVSIDDIALDFRGAAGTRLLSAMKMLDAP